MKDYFFALVVIISSATLICAIENPVYFQIRQIADGSKSAVPLGSNFVVSFEANPTVGSAGRPYLKYEPEVFFRPNLPVPVASGDSGGQSALANNLQPGKDWLLPAMGGTLIVLQGLDLYTTSRALEMGAVEGNPLMKSVVENPPLAIGVKAGVTAGVLGYVYLVNKQEGWGRPLAIVTLGVVDTLMMGVVANNIYVMSRLSGSSHRSVVPAVVSVNGSF